MNGILLRGLLSLSGLALSLAGLLLSGAVSMAQEWQAGAGDDWKRILDAARKEGKVVVASDTGTLGTTMPQAFKRDTGIEMEFLSGSPGELFTRMDREIKAGTLTIDVHIGGGTQVKFLQEGNLVPIKSQLILPSVIDPKNWIDGKMVWFDKAQQYMFQGSNWVHGWPIVNPKFVDPKTLTSWKDFLKPEFKGKIAAHDPRTGGPGQSAAAYLADTFGIGFVKQLYTNVTYTRDSRQLGEWVARGTYPIGLGSIQLVVEMFKAQGLDIAVPFLSDGPGSLTGGFSVSKQAKGVPHPNAAQVFHNWFANKNSQEIYAKSVLEASTRVDVRVAEVPDYINPKAGVKYLNQYEEEWYVNVRPKVANAIIEALGGR